ncbi:MAG: lipooligosaccharide transport system permease protein [Chloroflexota bacterium]|jgi:lipooligosaccharide transport system permease protein|nr:lipooligosaccharide transport system permease protein [Chloroflexota bacterium]
MTTIAQPLPTGALANAWARVWRSRRLVERNIMVYRHQWIIILSGVFEPIFYLLGIGLGVGGLIPEVHLPNGQVVAYAAFVAPALVATAAMNGAVFETIFNVFFKLNYAKTYDGVLATPMGITEIAIGEMLWALTRAALYAIAMFVIMLFMGLVLSPLGVLMIPASLLVAAAFAAAGLAGTSYLRTVNDFDVPMGLIVMPMFLFSGTFFPPDKVFTGGLAWVMWIVEATPLYHGINLIRGLSTGIIGIGQLWDLLYLVVFFVVCMWIAMRQMERKLIK